MRLLIFMFTLLFSASSFAVVNANGIAEIENAKFGLWGWGDVKEETKREGKHKAKIQAIKAWVAENYDEAQRKIYAKVENQVYENIDDYILSAIVVNEKIDSDNKRYRVVVKVKIDDTKISLITSVGERSSASVGFIFVTREESSVTEYDDAHTTIVKKITDKFNISKGGENIDKEVMVNRESSSTLKKRSKVIWRVASATKFTNEITKIFINRGIQPTDAIYLSEESGNLISVEKIKKDFAENTSINESLLNKIAEGAKKIGLNYLGIGTLDIELPKTDELTGNKKVKVHVNIQLINYLGDRPLYVATVNEVFSGQADTEKGAISNAITKAVKPAAEGLVAQLLASN